MQFFLIILILFFASSCGKNSVEKTEEAIDVALTYLSEKECDEALEVLLDAGVQNSNGVYLQVLASAYACKAGFDEINFVATDIPAMVTTSGPGIFKSLATLSLSAETAADSDSYSAIRSGINTILNSTTGAPLQVARTTKFGTRRAGDLGVQALILSLVNLGKFLRYYGNADSVGDKGKGPSSNKCFLDYNDPRAQLVITNNLGGACVSNTDGHADLDHTTAAGKRRLCEGIMLLTNAIDILDNIDLSSSSTLSKLEDVSTQVNTFKAAAVSVGLLNVIEMTSQSDCEAYAKVGAQLLNLEFFYAVVFEKGLL